MVVHLHWSKNPKLVRETRTGITVCGIKAPRDELTASAADTTCKDCLARTAPEPAVLHDPAHKPIRKAVTS